MDTFVKGLLAVVLVSLLVISLKVPPLSLVSKIKNKWSFVPFMTPKSLATQINGPKQLKQIIFVVRWRLRECPIDHNLTSNYQR